MKTIDDHIAKAIDRADLIIERIEDGTWDCYAEVYDNVLTIYESLQEIREQVAIEKALKA